MRRSSSAGRGQRLRRRRPLRHHPDRRIVLDHRKRERTQGEDRNLATSQARQPSRHRQGHLQMATPDRELLRQAEGIQTHSNAMRQDRRRLRSDDLPRHRCHSFQINLDRPQKERAWRECRTFGRRSKAAPRSLGRVQSGGVLARSDIAVRHCAGRTKIWPG